MTKLKRENINMCGNFKDLLENKTVCLFYDNPVAGEIYKNLGFEDICFWNLWKSTQV
ncbi:MAG: hypothetical protein RR891_00580 [Clostridium sp.]|uniref:hypothetical protein n=1 Tax=Clostridium sp. TaxID=1506 RepID=UPI00303F58A0